VVVLSDGSVVAGGHYGEGMDFAVGLPEETGLSGESNGWLARYSSDGVLQWARGIGGIDWESTADLVTVAAAADDAILAGGHFNGQLLLGDGAGGGLTVAPGGAEGDRGYVARWSAEGVPLWVRTVTPILFSAGSSNARIYDVEALADGDILALCAFGGTALIDGGGAGATEYTAIGDTDAIVLRYDADGNLVSAFVLDGEGGPWTMELAARPDGAFVASSRLTEPMTLGPGQPGETTLYPDGDGSDCFGENQDLALAAFDADGQLLWANAVWSSGCVGAYDFVLHADGTLLMTGYLPPEGVTLGVGSGAELALAGGAAQGSFFAAFDAGGVPVWATAQDGSVNSLVPLDDGGYLATGSYEEIDAVFGPGEWNETVLPLEGAGDGFAALYGSEHDLLFAVKLPGGAGSGGSVAAAVLPGGFVTAGSFLGDAVWGVGETSPITETAPPVLPDAFVARYDFAE
jgi:hypothetical protein